MDLKTEEWNNSYRKKNNFVFYPHEEIVRFTSKYIKKQIGLTEFIDVYKHHEKLKALDLGCGIGRHVIYLHNIGIDSYGVDLSDEAIEFARNWAETTNIGSYRKKIIQGDIQKLVWEDNFFNFIISHGVLDSMFFDLAKKSIQEVYRVLRPDGLFYLDLVSGDDSNHAREFAEDEEVTNDHEKGTIQSYYNYSKILRLINDYFVIVEINLVKRENIISGISNARYHLVLKKPL